jgi:hypothetical protein
MCARLLSEQVGFVTEKVVLLIFPELRSAFNAENNRIERAFACNNGVM